MNRHAALHGTTWVAALVVGVLAIGGAVAAQGLGAERLATVSVSSDGVHWQPEIEHGGAVLTLSGGGDVLRYSFAGGEAPFISAFDDQGELLPDGVSIGNSNCC